MKKELIATLVVLLVCVSVSSVQAYTNDKYNFSIDPPSGWTIDDTQTVAAVIFYGPVGEGVSMNIEVESLPTPMTLEQYISAVKQLLPTFFSNYELLSEGTRGEINEVEAYELVYTFTQGSIDVKAKQVALVKDKKAYVISYGGTPTGYQEYLPAFEASVETFQILEPEPTPWYIQYWYVWVIVAAAVAALSVFYLRRRRARALPPPTTCLLYTSDAADE